MVTIYDSPPCEHHSRRKPISTALPTTISHDRTLECDIYDALYSVFGHDGVDPNAPHIEAHERRALRIALRERGVDPATVLVPRGFGPRVPAINTFELRDNPSAYEEESV